MRIRNHYIMFALLFAFTVHSAVAQQADFITEGTIEFEKNTNKFAVIEKMAVHYGDAMKEEVKKYKLSQSQFVTLKSTLSFSGNTTLFTPLADENSIQDNYFNGKPIAEQFNTVFNDLKNGTVAVQKKVFDELFLVKDSARHITWKITDETREIAGFTCRRANGLIMDSIYVVAFFTNKIPVSGGPESFYGLPGMILGVAVPYENVTWFATKVTATSGNQKPLLPPAKGQPVTYKVLTDKLDAAFRQKGGLGVGIFKRLLL